MGILTGQGLEEWGTQRFLTPRESRSIALLARWCDDQAEDATELRRPELLLRFPCAAENRSLMGHTTELPLPPSFRPWRPCWLKTPAL